MPLVDLLFRRHRDKTILALLVILSLSLMALPRPAKTGFAQTVLNAVFYPAERVGQYFDDFVSVRSENRELKRLVASLSLERERLIQFREERARLRRVAEFKEEQFIELLPAEVIGRNLDRYQTTLIIDKGVRDSLEVRMPVLSYNGYVGRVEAVFERTAWIRLIASRNNPVSCINKRSRVVGILEWRNHSYFSLSNVSVVEDVQVGDTLLTSGYGGVAPKGYPVAIVSKVTPAIDGLSLKVDAKSHIEFRSLEEVFVAIDQVPWDRAIYYDDQDSTLMPGGQR